jgi:NAD dependent epimerase/dehydratase family enzyme
MTFLMFNESVSGPVNLTAPEPVTNLEFTKTLGQVLRRPTILPVPGFALRSLYRDLADQALLVSQRAEPMRLEQAGFKFRQPHLERTLRELLGRP